MNAMEHGNKYRAEVPVEVMVLVEDQDLMVRITDRVVGRHRPGAGMRRIWRRSWKVCKRPEDGDCSL